MAKRNGRRSSGRSGGTIVVAAGEGWTLAWPADDWNALTPDEQRQAIERQRALIGANEDARTSRRRKPARPGAVASGALSLKVPPSAAAF